MIKVYISSDIHTCSAVSTLGIELVHIVRFPKSFAYISTALGIISAVSVFSAIKYQRIIRRSAVCGSIGVNRNKHVHVVGIDFCAYFRKRTVVFFCIRGSADIRIGTVETA